MISEAKLDFWIKHGLNVLFTGRHGVGKTATIVQAFDRAKLKWRYFSAATMDPWVDFIGVPKEQKNGHGTYLDLVRPLEFQQDTIEALFFDEFNRAHKKVRNACMELIQFRSINGKKFNNLRLVWAAINPEDEEEYDVDPLDPAQRDRFQVEVAIPYKPHLPYFMDRYGEDTARAAVAWWNGLPQGEKNKISPRRLDYALDMLDKKGDLRDIIPASANVGKLLVTLKTGPIVDLLSKFIQDSDRDGARTFLSQENNYAAAISYVCGRAQFLQFFVPLLADEKISSLMATNDTVVQFVAQAAATNARMQQIVQDIINAKQNKRLANKLNKLVAKNPQLLAKVGVGGLTKKGQFVGGNSPTKPHWQKGVVASVFSTHVHSWIKRAQNANTTYDRKCLCEDIRDGMCQTMNAWEAHNVIQILSTVAGRCQRATIKSWNTQYKLTGILNHCIETLANFRNEDWLGLATRYSLNGEVIVEKLADAGYGPKIFVPTSNAASPQAAPVKAKKISWQKGMKKKVPVSGSPPPKTKAISVGKTCPNCQALVGCRKKFCSCGHKFY